MTHPTGPIAADRMIRANGRLYGRRNGYVIDYGPAPSGIATMGAAGYGYDNGCDGDDCGCPRCSMGYTDGERKAWGRGIIVGGILGALLYKATR
jgi:hypothetical protein